MELINLLLACLFRRKGEGFVIVRLSSSASSKNFNVAHYSKCIKSINTKLAHLERVQLQDKRLNLERYMFRVMPLFK